jgi:hypothetical protein
VLAATARPKPDFETLGALYHPDHVLVPLVPFGTTDPARALAAAGGHG